MKRKYMLFSLLGVLMVQFGFAQQKTITGNITDETGNALPGATILIENTQRGNVNIDNLCYLKKVDETGKLILITKAKII
jgi:outer membrane usher protein FimD/PapC